MDGTEFGEGLDEDLLKAGGRSFCRLGTPFTPIYQIVSEGVKWELARDIRLRGEASPIRGPGSTPSKEEIKSIEKTTLV